MIVILEREKGAIHRDGYYKNGNGIPDLFEPRPKPLEHAVPGSPARAKHVFTFPALLVINDPSRSWRDSMVSMVIEMTVLIATLAGVLAGGCGIYFVKMLPNRRHARWGRRLFVATLLWLGGTALFAALTHADGLAPLGLLSGLLVVGMLWEGSPMPAADTSSQ
jgi:hypothetical protein